MNRILHCFANLWPADASTWKCQTPGSCAYCPACPACQEGPGGTPGGCGYCEFCSPASCPQPHCVLDQATSARGAVAGADCAAVNRNLRAQVLVLNINSWTKSNGAQNPPQVTTAAACCDECKRTPGCSGWTFCYKLDGCGSGCQPTGPQDAQHQRCEAHGPYATCTPEGKYPAFTCSLKRVEDRSNITYWDGEDWTSGVLAASQAESSSETQPTLPCLL